MRSFSRRSGFTLIELLVVIAIIAILIALLVPAVQKVREAAARTQCSNNLKQLGLAVHAYHGEFNRLPPGTTQDQAPWGPGASNWGASWLVYILPYVEQEGLYRSLTIGGGTGYGNTANGAQYTDKVISVYRCPASTLPTYVTGTVPGSGRMMQPTYCGIAGAVTGIISGFNEQRYTNPGTATGCCSGGILSFGGVLAPNSDRKLTDILDGTSNTMMIGEQSTELFTTSNAKVAWNAAGPHGWTIGWGNTSSPRSPTSIGDSRAFNVTTIRYNINQIRGWTDAPGNCGSQGVCDNAGQNIPLNVASTPASPMDPCDFSMTARLSICWGVMRPEMTVWLLSNIPISI